MPSFVDKLHEVSTPEHENRNALEVYEGISIIFVILCVLELIQITLFQRFMSI